MAAASAPRSRPRAARTLLAAAAAVLVLGPGPARAEADLTAAATALEQLEYDRAVSLLRAAPAEQVKGSARFHYLLGASLLRQTEREVAKARQQTGQRPDELTPPQAESFREALGHLEQVVALDPKGPDAPEAAFLAALLTDYGYLQRLGQTMEKYRAVVRDYPGTKAAEKARKQVETREGLFKIH